MYSVHSRYIVLSPMKNEESYVSKTLEAMISQTHRPVEWLIVNDGSTDRSAEIVARYSAHHSWIRMVDVEGLSNRSRGGHVVDLIYEGLRHIKAADFEFLVKLDCDVSFGEDFFQTIFQVCEQNPRLGITSGVSFVLRNGVLTEEKAAPEHTLGATKIYRKECFADIGGLVPSMGWDGIDEIKARLRGWEARPLRELVVLHHRPEGAAKGFLASGVERGKGSYFMGYHPMFLLARALRRMLRPRLFADGVGMLTGYLWSVVSREPRIPDPDLIRVLRRTQVRELLRLRRES
jgi:biofilm PGA synthesis N-glycosyltransferase PgaC